MGLSNEEEKKLHELKELDKSELNDGDITGRVQLALQRKYEYSEWALFFEVTGKNGHRADAIAYNLYPSRNFKTIGFEIKASRQDWKKELREGSKADWFVGQVDKWYVLAGRKGIVKEKELPDGWGLLEMKGGGRLYKEVESDLTDHQDRPVDREFYVRGIQKAMKKWVQVKRDLSWKKDQAYQKGLKEGRKERGGLDRDTKRLVKKGKKLEELRDHGLYFSRMSDDDIKRHKTALDLVKKIDSKSHSGFESHLSVLRDYTGRIDDEIQEFEEKLEDLESEVKEDV